MSGWSPADKYMEENVFNDLPAINNATQYGYLPSDQIPAPTRSRNIVEAHMKSLRLFRKYCRYMPFIVNWHGLRRYTSPEKAKLQLAQYWRQNNRVRDPENVDQFVRAGYERLYNIQQGDIWGTQILDQIAPVSRSNISEFQGFSYHEEVRFKNKSTFLKGFYKGGNRPQY